MSLRNLQRRTAKLEQARKPRPSPFVLWFGSFDTFVEQALAGIEQGKLDQADMVVIVASLRSWEANGVWEVAYATG